MTSTATAAHWYGLGLAMAWGGVTEGATTYFMDWMSDTIKVSLHNAGYTPNQDTDQFWSNTGEVAGTTVYTTGGKALASTTLAYSSNVITFDAADTAWSAGTVALSNSLAVYAVIYDSTPGDASHRPLLGYVDFTNAGQYSLGTGTFTITWATAGILTITIGT